MDMEEITIGDTIYKVRSTIRVAFVNAEGVAVRVENHGHATDGRGHRLDAELHAFRAQVFDFEHNQSGCLVLIAVKLNSFLFC
jgi:hypothetical protein